MNEPTKFLVVTHEEAELILDSVRVGDPRTRALALKAAGLVLEYAAEAAVRRAEGQARLSPGAPGERTDAGGYRAPD